MVAIKIALRSILQTPFVSLVAVLSLALGIGANTAIFSLFEQTLLQTLPVLEPDRLVNLANPGPKPGSQRCGASGPCSAVFSYPMFKDLQAAPSGFSGIGAYMNFGVNLASDSGTVSGEGLAVSGSYFPVLGVRPALGRLLGPDDEAGIGESFVTVLSHGFWQTRFGGDPGALNRPLIVNGQPMTIVGVAPAGFAGTTFGMRADVFVPITMRVAMNAAFDDYDNRTAYWAYLFARLKPGVSLQQATADVNAVYTRLVNDVEAPLQEGMSAATMERFRAKLVTVEPGAMGQSSTRSEASTPLRLLFGIAATVLLIACANVANLLLARGARRAQEMAIRGSLGANRLQLIRQLLTESLLLALIGGAAGLLVARWTLALLPRLLPQGTAASLAFELRPSMVLFSAAVALATGLAFGLYPALHATRPDLVSALRASAGQPSGNRAAIRFRNALATAQLALSLVLLVAAALFLKSLVNISRVDLGLRVESMVTFGISPDLNGYEAAESMALFERTEEALAALPGVSAVAAARVAVLSGSSWGNNVTVEGFESGPDIDTNSRYNAVSAGYFRALGIPLMSGREFTPADVLGAPPVAIVNETFARKFNLDPRSALGKRMAVGGGDVELEIEIVGVAQDAKYNAVKGETPPLYFLPYRQVENLGDLTFYAHAADGGEALMRAIPAAMARLDPNLPVEQLRTLESQLQENVYLDRMITSMSAAFAALATVVALIGLYGVLTYTVAQRTREIGVRMALGADRWSVRGMVLGHVGRMLLVGGAIGIGGALLVGRAAGSLLFGLEGNDPVVIASVVVLLATAALAAGYFPARRASRVDPMRALRFD